MVWGGSGEPEIHLQQKIYVLLNMSAMIPANIVDAVCHVPYASHPSYSQGYYDRDNEFYLAWDKISESQESIKAYLDEWVCGVKDREEYWEKLGAEKHTQLEVAAALSEPVNYGKY